MQQKIGDCVILLMKKDYPRNFIMEEMNDDKGRDLGNRESVAVRLGSHGFGWLVRLKNKNKI